MSESGNFGEGKQLVTSIEIVKGREVTIEELLMKLALTKSVFNDMSTCLAKIEKKVGSWMRTAPRLTNGGLLALSRT